MFYSVASFCVYRPFCLPILQQGQVGGILLPLQISSRSLRPTRHERFNQTSKKPAAIYHYLPRSNENSVKHQRQDHQKGGSSNLRVKKRVTKRELGENWGPYNILLRAQPPSSHLPVPRRERKGEDGIGGRGVERPLRSAAVKQEMAALLGVRRCARPCLP